jgi:tRNA-dihydrouridine synthase A
MMDWTDRHDRFFLRLISRHARLYTEMVTSDAIRHGDRARLLDFNAQEHPLALQLGGSDPQGLAEAARIGEEWGYDEINLNVGCPSDRVQSGQFGACLMKTPALVAECVAAMSAVVDIPVTVKCRIGVDEQEPSEALPDLVAQCAAAGVRHFIVHARMAWLEGLSPKQNRDVPPLDYALVYQLKKAHPELTIVINGGIEDLAQVDAHLNHVDGVMLGRAAYKTPYLLSTVDGQYFNDDTAPLTRHEIVEQLIPYAENLVASGIPLHALTRHLMGLYQGQPGGRHWRRYLSENAPGHASSANVLREALAHVQSYEQKQAAYANQTGAV